MAVRMGMARFLSLSRLTFVQADPDKPKSWSAYHKPLAAIPLGRIAPIGLALTWQAPRQAVNLRSAVRSAIP